MNERFAVVFRNGESESAGALEVEQDRLLLHGCTSSGALELEIPVSDISQVRVGRRADERLNGYPTLLLERPGMPAVQVAPLGVALLPEITDLLASLTQGTGGNVLAVSVPLRPGCLGRARELLRKGPPLDPASLGLRGHEVFLREGEAIFVFRGSDVRARISTAIRHPAIWRAGLAWQRCLAGPPRIVDITRLHLEVAPAYQWAHSSETERDSSA